MLASYARAFANGKATVAEVDFAYEQWWRETHSGTVRNSKPVVAIPPSSDPVHQVRDDCAPADPLHHLTGEGRL
jgi:hypothetical protein